MSGKSTLAIISESQVEALIGDDVRFYVDTVEETFAYHGRGTHTQPPKSYMYWHGGCNRLNLMPAYLSAPYDIIGVKCVTSVPDNPRCRGIPRGQSTLLLFSQATGQLLAIFEGTKISAMRTAAMTVVAARHLAPNPTNSLGILGAGPIAFAHVVACYHELGISNVMIFDINRKVTERFADEVRSAFPIEVVEMEDGRAAVSGADVVVTATSSSEAFVDVDWIKPGTLVSNIGVMELKPAVFGVARVVIVDDYVQCTQKPRPLKQAIDAQILDKEAIIEMGKIICGAKVVPRVNGDIIIFNPIGMGMLDVACGKKLLDRARVAGLISA